MSRLRALRRRLRQWKKRVRLAYAALRGYDFILDDRTRPGHGLFRGSWDVGVPDWTGTVAEERRAALLGRAGEREMRWYALRRMLNRIEDGEENFPMFGEAVGCTRGDIVRLVRTFEREAWTDAKDAVRERMVVCDTDETDDQGIPIEHVVEDPRLDMKFRIAATASDRLRMDQEEFIDHFHESFPERVLVQFLEETDGVEADRK